MKPDCTLTAAQLLIGFFEFYARRFRPEKHVITISDGNQFMYKSEYRVIIA